jgi:hemerythrin-like domain-containing protein
MKLKCTNHLAREHKLILRAVYVLQAMADRAIAGALPVPADVEKLLWFFNRFGDKHHQGKEEAVLFRALKRLNGPTSRPLHLMMSEHERERTLLLSLEDALRTRNCAAFADNAYSLAQLLSNHIHKEDNIFFDLVERVVSTDIDIQITLGMVECDELLTQEKYCEFTRTVNDLEWKYLGKAA